MRRPGGCVLLAIALTTGGCTWGVQREQQVVLEGEFKKEIEVIAEDEFVAIEPQPVPPEFQLPPDGPAFPDIPAFVISSGFGTVEVPPYRACWDLGEGGPCRTSPPQPERALLAATGLVSVQLEPGDRFFAAVSRSIDGDWTEVTATGRDDGWELDVADLEPGDQLLWLEWFGVRGEAHAVLTLRVMPAE